MQRRVSALIAALVIAACSEDPNRPLNPPQPSFDQSAPLATDNFNRADANPLSGSWTRGGGGFGDLQLVSNALQGASATARNVGFYNGVTWPDDQWSEVKVASLTSARNGGPAVRISATSETAYVFAVGSDGYYIGKRVNGVWTELANGATTFAVGDVLQLEAEGDTIRAYKNGMLVQYVLDATIPSGNAGIWIYQNDPALRFDDWAGGVPAPTPPAAPTSLAATAVSSSQIDLSWTDNAGNEEGFRIERCSGAGCTEMIFVEIATVGPNAVSYQNTGLTASTSYGYRVRAFNAGGVSAYSNTSTATTSAAVWPNWPAGFGDTITSQPFDSEIPAGHGVSYPPECRSSSFLWWVYGNQNGYLTKVDSSAPFSSPNVAQFRYPVNFVDGVSPATPQCDFTGRTQLYVGLWWKANAEWQQHPSGVSKLQYLFTDTDGSMLMAMCGPPGGPYKLCVYRQFVLPDTGWVNTKPDAPAVTLGQWHRIEWLVQYNEGVVRWWLDGVLSGDTTGLHFPVQPLKHYKLAPVWGGNDGSKKAREDFFWYDHIFISAPPP